MLRLGLGLALAGATAACGDPLVILGDWPGMMRVVVGIPTAPGSTVDSLATRSRITTPRGLAVDAAGVLYVADQRPRVLAVKSSGRMEVLLDHSMCRQPPCLRRPDAAVLDGAGGLLLADPIGAQVLRLDLVSGAVTVVAGTGVSGEAPDGVPAVEANLGMPTGLAIAADGRVFFTERISNKVRVVEPDGRLVTLAGTGESGFDGDGGPAAAARLRTPTGLALHGSMLYIADTGNQRIRAVDLETGVIETVAGSGTAGFTGDGGLVLNARLNSPEAIALTADGQNLFIADTNNHRVRVVNLRTGIIHTFAGTGDPLFAGDGRMAAETALRRPGGLFVSPQNLLFISDANHIVWRTPVRL